ncbi:MAG: helix-turn-helix domain-containing protein [Chloroflexota bacterium]|nr:helix-turn-helix domain-containing protein [Chloroflexota bacterium]
MPRKVRRRGPPRLHRDAGPIARMRCEIGWTQAEAAERLGLCLRNYQRLESSPRTGAERPISDIDALGRVFGKALGRQVKPFVEFFGYPRPSDWQPEVDRQGRTMEQEIRGAG